MRTKRKKKTLAKIENCIVCNTVFKNKIVGIKVYCSNDCRKKANYDLPVFRKLRRHFDDPIFQAAELGWATRRYRYELADVLIN